MLQRTIPRVVVRRCVQVPRRFTTTWKSEPPWLVRVGLVGVTVGAATPVFPVIGLYRLACHVFPDKWVRVAAVGSGTAIMSFGFRDLLPMLIEHGELVAPFALTNGLTASAAYAGLEATAGRLRLTRWPSFLIGAGLGGFTGAVAPYWYSTALHLSFGLDLDLRRYIDWLLPVSVPTGLAAGAVLGPVLRPVIAGIEGIPWTRVAGPVKLGAIGFVAWVYGRALWICNRPVRLDEYFNNQIDMSKKRYLYIDPEMREKALSLLRLDVRTGDRASSNPRTGLPIADKGLAADLAQRLSDTILTEPVYPNIRAARLAYALDRFPLLSSILQVGKTPETSSLQPGSAAHVKAMNTDLIARLAFLIFQQHHNKSDATFRTVYEAEKANTTISVDETQLSTLADQALGVIALLQRADQDITDPEDLDAKKFLATSLLGTASSTVALDHLDPSLKVLASDLHFGQLCTILTEAKVQVPFQCWLDYKACFSSAAAARRRRASLIFLSMLLTTLGYFTALKN